MLRGYHNKADEICSTVCGDLEAAALPAVTGAAAVSLRTLLRSLSDACISSGRGFFFRIRTFVHIHRTFMQHHQQASSSMLCPSRPGCLPSATRAATDWTAGSTNRCLGFWTRCLCQMWCEPGSLLSKNPCTILDLQLGTARVGLAGLAGLVGSVAHADFRKRPLLLLSSLTG